MKSRLQRTDRAGLQPTEAGPSDEEEPISRTRPGVGGRFAVSIRSGPSRGSRLSRHSSRAFGTTVRPGCADLFERPRHTKAAGGSMIIMRRDG